MCTLKGNFAYQNAQNYIFSRKNSDPLPETHFCFICPYTTLTNFSIKYLAMCNVYTNVGGIK